jgi:hypothetical protein
MKLQQTYNQHKDDRPAKKNNAFFADNEIVCCLKTPDLAPDPFKDGAFRWEVPVVYLDENGLMQGGKWTFGSDPSGKGKWDATFGEADEWPCHNAKLAYNVPGNPQKGYSILFVEQPVEACPCKKRGKATSTSNGNGHGPVDSSGIDTELHAMGFEGAPATPGEKKAVKILAMSLRQPVPENLDHMTSQEANEHIDRLQQLQVVGTQDPF